MSRLGGASGPVRKAPCEFAKLRGLLRRLVLVVHGGPAGFAEAGGPGLDLTDDGRDDAVLVVDLVRLRGGELREPLVVRSGEACL